MTSTPIILVAWVVAACGGAPTQPRAGSAPPDQASYRIEPTPGGPAVGVVNDLQAPRTRSYYTLYVVAVESGGQASALVPRPDRELAASCNTSNELTVVAQRAGLCGLAVSEAAFVDRINRLPIEDGLRVQRFLERTIQFTASRDSEGAWSVWPFPNKRDVTTVCQPKDRSGLSEALCEFYSPQHVTEEMQYFPEDDTKLLARRLNELYRVQ